MPIVVNGPVEHPDTVRVRRVRVELAKPGPVSEEQIRRALDDPIPTSETLAGPRA